MGLLGWLGRVRGRPGPPVSPGGEEDDEGSETDEELGHLAELLELTPENAGSGSDAEDDAEPAGRGSKEAGSSSGGREDGHLEDRTMCGTLGSREPCAARQGWRSRRLLLDRFWRPPRTPSTLCRGKSQCLEAQNELCTAYELGWTRRVAMLGWGRVDTCSHVAGSGSKRGLTRYRQRTRRPSRVICKSAWWIMRRCY